MDTFRKGPLTLLAVTAVLTFVIWGAAEAAAESSFRFERDHIHSRHYDATTLNGLVAFVNSLPHGREITRLRIYVDDELELAKRCGRGAEGCYYPTREAMFVPGGPLGGHGVTPAEVVAHEYGHHISNNRPGLAYGTPRWDVVEHVCLGVNQHQLAPEAESGPNVWANPEEAFAEAYASIVFPNIGATWRYSSLLVPSSSSYRAILLDIYHPWTKRYANWRLSGSCQGQRNIYQ